MRAGLRVPVTEEDFAWVVEVHPPRVYRGARCVLHVAASWASDIWESAMIGGIIGIVLAILLWRVAF